MNIMTKPNRTSYEMQCGRIITMCIFTNNTVCMQLKCVVEIYAIYIQA